MIQFASDRRRNAAYTEEVRSNPFETGLIVTEYVLILFLNGAKYVLEKDACRAIVRRENGALALCNTFRHLPAVKTAVLPIVFGLILAVASLWFLVWVETEVLGVAFTPLWSLTHAVPQSVGCVFLAAMGVYAPSYGICQLALTLRFGE